MRHFLCVSTRIFGGAVGGEHSGDRFDGSLSISRKVIEGPSSIQTVAEIFAVLSEQGMDSRRR